MLDNRFKNIFLPVLRSSVFRRLFLSAVMIQVMFGCIAAVRGNLDEYMAMSVVTLVINFAITFYGCHQGANKITIFIFVALFNIGILIQNIVGVVAVESSLMITAICLLLTVGYAVLHSLLKRCKFTTEFSLLALALGIVAIFLILLIFGKSENGTTAWLRIGGISLQPTEIAKLLYLLFLVVLYKSDYKDLTKFLIGFVLMAIMAMCLFIIGELGTLFLIASVFIFFSLIYLKSNLKWWLFAAIIFLVVVVFAGYNIIHPMLDKWECPTCDATNSGLICNECLYDDNELTKGERPSSANATFRCDYCRFMTWSDGTETCPECEANGEFFRSMVGGQIKKVHDRFSVFLDYESVKDSDIGYNAKKAQEAALVGGWTGNGVYKVAVPNIHNDFIFSAVLLHLGFLFGIFVILLFFMLFFRVMFLRSPLKVAAVLSLSLQAIIMITGSINIMVMTGVGVPFLSSGGTNMLVTFILVYHALSRGDWIEY